jgi:hypothetical protein
MPSKTQNTDSSKIQYQNQTHEPTISSNSARSYKMADPENVMENERVTNLVMQQIKELIQIDNNLNSKLKEIENKVTRTGSSFTDIKNSVDRFSERLDFIEKNLEKFMGLYEVVTNIFNPFTTDSNKSTIVQKEDAPFNRDNLSHPETSSASYSAVNPSGFNSNNSSSNSTSISSSSVNNTKSNVTSESKILSQQNKQQTTKSTASNNSTSTGPDNSSAHKENQTSQQPQKNIEEKTTTSQISPNQSIPGKEQAQNRFAELKRQKESAANTGSANLASSTNPPLSPSINTHLSSPTPSLIVIDNNELNHSANSMNSNIIINPASTVTNTDATHAMTDSPINVEIRPTLKNDSRSGLTIIDSFNMPISSDPYMNQSSRILADERSESNDGSLKLSSEISAAQIDPSEPSCLTGLSSSDQLLLPSLYAGEVSSEYHFSLAGGKDIKSIADLISGLKGMDDKTFKNYVNDDSNDFAEWIGLVSENKDAADLLSPLNERLEFIAALECMITEDLTSIDPEKGVP